MPRYSRDESNEETPAEAVVAAPTGEIPSEALVTPWDVAADEEPVRNRYNLVTNSEGVLVSAERS